MVCNKYALRVDIYLQGECLVGIGWGGGDNFIGTQENDLL